MDLTVQKSAANGAEKKVVITLAGVVTVSEVQKIKEALLSAFMDCAELQLDVGKITTTDLALQQLIHAARRTAVSEGKKFTLAGELSAPFQEMLRSAGFPLADGGDIKSACSATLGVINAQNHSGC